MGITYVTNIKLLTEFLKKCL